MNSIKEMQRFKELYQKFRFLAENDENFTFINNNKNDIIDSDSKRGYIKKMKPIESNEYRNINNNINNDNGHYEKFTEKHNKKIYQFNDN